MRERARERQRERQRERERDREREEEDLNGLEREEARTSARLPALTLPLITTPDKGGPLHRKTRRRGGGKGNGGMENPEAFSSEVTQT